MEVIFIAALLLGLWWWLRSETEKKYGKLKPRPKTPKAKPAAMQEAVSKIAPYTHDWDTAARVLHGTRMTNHGRPLEWCVSKTIEDIVRDRR